MDKRPLEALFFDVDDTVYSITEFAELARRNAIRAMIDTGLEMDEEEAMAELREVIAEFSSNHERHFDKLIRRLPPASYAHSSPLLLIAAGVVAYHQTKFRHFTPYEDAVRVLGMLKERGLKLGIITAGVAIKQAEKIYRLGLHRLAAPRFIYISDELGIAKSNPKIYQRACDEAGAPVAHCMYIGDNPTVDVDVPAALGMRTVLSRRSGKYMDVPPVRDPDHVVHNFYDLLEIIDSQYEIAPVADPAAEVNPRASTTRVFYGPR